ncbi:hypothetical protein ACFYXF_51260 [Streptomyces sp. NPDC002680]|uniref:hypothetical protein n=1 Tax=Streptomyces sp. NPDC002680 TaxID=3364659 RepID=UPI0036A200DC
MNPHSPLVIAAHALPPHRDGQHLVTGNTTLKRRLHQMTQDNRSVQERLEGARSNLLFADKRIADLEVELLELTQLLVTDPLDLLIDRTQEAR